MGDPVTDTIDAWSARPATKKAGADHVSDAIDQWAGPQPEKGSPAEAPAEPDTKGAISDYIAGIRNGALAAPLLGPLGFAAGVTAGGIKALRRPGVPQAIAEGAKDIGKDIIKDELAKAPVVAAMGPAALITPFAERPLTKMVRAAVPNEAKAAIGLGKDPETSTRDAFVQGAKQGAIETGTNAALWGVGALKALPAAIAARGGDETVIKAMSGYLKNIIENGGSLEAQKATAQKLYDKAAEMAPDLKVPAKNFVGVKDTIVKEAEQGMGINPAAKKIIKEIDRTIEGGGELTLGQMNAKLRDLGNLATATKKKPHMQRLLLMAKDALDADMAAAADGTPLEEAAGVLSEARAGWHEMKVNTKLNDLMLKSIDPSSVEGHISPEKLASAASGRGWEQLQKELSAYPEKLDKVRQVVNAARLMSKRGTGESWAGFLPEAVKTPKVEAALDNIMSTGEVFQTITDPEFKKFLRPHGVNSEGQALEIIGNISSRLASRRGMGVANAVVSGAPGAGKYLIDQARSLFDIGQSEEPPRTSPFPQDLRAQAGP